jgi:hypothetical protein
MNLLREPDAGNPHVRFDEREVETERLASQRHLSTPPFSTSVPFSTFPFSTFQSCPGFALSEKQMTWKPVPPAEHLYRGPVEEDRPPSLPLPSAAAVMC